MNKKADLFYFFPYILIVVVLVALIIFVSIEAIVDINHKKTCEKCKIIDILDVSAGGLGHSDKCLYQTTCGKKVLNDCSLKIGDEVCRE